MIGGLVTGTVEKVATPILLKVLIWAFAVALVIIAAGSVFAWSYYKSTQSEIKELTASNATLVESLTIAVEKNKELVRDLELIKKTVEKDREIYQAHATEIQKLKKEITKLKNAIPKPLGPDVLPPETPEATRLAGIRAAAVLAAYCIESDDPICPVVESPQVPDGTTGGNTPEGRSGAKSPHNASPTFLERILK